MMNLWQDFKGSNHGMIKLLSQHLPGGLRSIMKSISQDNGRIKDQYCNYPSLIFQIKFKPKGQIINYETHYIPIVKVKFSNLIPSDCCGNYPPLNCQVRGGTTTDRYHSFTRAPCSESVEVSTIALASTYCQGGSSGRRQWMKWERDFLFCHNQNEILINSSTFMTSTILQPLAYYPSLT